MRLRKGGQELDPFNTGRQFAATYAYEVDPVGRRDVDGLRLFMFIRIRVDHIDRIGNQRAGSKRCAETDMYPGPHM